MSGAGAQWWALGFGLWVSIGGWTFGISMVLVMMIFHGLFGDLRPGSC